MIGKKGIKNKNSNSRLHFYWHNSLLKYKHAQLAIFVIIALVIVSVLLIMLLPTIKKAVVGPDADVELKSCLKENVQEALEIALAKGGSMNPELYYRYDGENIDYLCYINEYYKTCIMQKPFLKQSIESEIKKSVQPEITKCINDIEKSLRSKGYEVKTAGTGAVKIQIVPKSVVMTIDLQIAVEKEQKKKVYEKFNADFSSGAYNLIMIASSISNWEARYGDAAPETYMMYYSNIKVEKKIQSDETTIYILTDRTTKEKLIFASRSIAWSAGYAV